MNSDRFGEVGSKPGTFAIGEQRRVETFSQFADFTAKLTEKLNGGQKLAGLTASGSFDAASSELTSQRVLATFKP